jgi:hypothetical protein
MKFKLISCEVMYREMCFAVARSPHQVDLEFLPKGLHDIGCVGMLERLQASVDRVDQSRYDAILLGYCLCNNGIAGLRARQIPLVVPRGHDCMTMFLGSKERYLEYFQNNPGTFFLTSGWIERGEDNSELHQLSIQHASGMDMSYESLVERYGEDNAKFLYAELCDQTKHYSAITFIDMGIEPDGSFRRIAQERARDKDWSFRQVPGDMRLIRSLVDGIWVDQDFLVVPPGHSVAVRHDEQIITAVRDAG